MDFVFEVLDGAGVFEAAAGIEQGASNPLRVQRLLAAVRKGDLEARAEFCLGRMSARD